MKDAERVSDADMEEIAGGAGKKPGTVKNPGFEKKSKKSADQSKPERRPTSSDEERWGGQGSF